MNNESIFCSGFVIESIGDESVGIFRQEWVLKGDFEFESKSDFESFKEKLNNLFEYCGEPSTNVYSLEELNEMAKYENDSFEDINF